VDLVWHVMEPDAVIATLTLVLLGIIAMPIVQVKEGDHGRECKARLQGNEVHCVSY